MRAAEKNLLLAVRNRLRTATGSGGAGFSDAECDIEFDEMAPATQGHRYIVVMPAGWRPGPRHNTSGGVNDLIYAVDVTVIQRVANVARDRYRTTLTALEALADLIFPVVDFNYTTLAAANTLLAAETPSSTEGFSEPLRFIGMGKPRLVSGELFGGAEPKAGLARTVSFGGARRITVKT